MPQFFTEDFRFICITYLGHPVFDNPSQRIYSLQANPSQRLYSLEANSSQRIFSLEDIISLADNMASPFELRPGTTLYKCLSCQPTCNRTSTSKKKMYKLLKKCLLQGTNTFIFPLSRTKDSHYKLLCGDQKAKHIISGIFPGEMASYHLIHSCFLRQPKYKFVRVGIAKFMFHKQERRVGRITAA